MSRSELKCPVCDGVDLDRRGRPRYRPPTRVAGVPIELGDLDLMHYRCRRCTYQFVWPPIPQQRLIDCYVAASSKNWATDQSVASQRGYDAKRRVLEQFAPGRRVLDFGCFDGGFLQYLGERWETYGIEPSTEAADRARGRGVRVLGPTVDAVGPEYAGTFHGIVNFDVMEHLTDPVGVLRSLAGLLAPGGVMLVETGNSDASHWRLAGNAYWYCGLVEHVGFFNKQSIRVAGARAGLELARFERTMHHSDIPLRDHLRAPFVAAGYYALRAARGIGVSFGSKLDRVLAGTTPTSLDVRDHFLAVLRKPA